MYTAHFPDNTGSEWSTCPQCHVIDSKVNMVHRGNGVHYCKECEAQNQADYEEMIEMIRQEVADEMATFWREAAIADGTPWTDENGVKHYPHHASEAPDDDDLPF